MNVDERAPSAVLAVVSVGPGAGRVLPPAAQRRLVRAVVETSLHLPGMFELTFQDTTGGALQEAGLRIGAAVQIKGGPPGGADDTRLIVGEVTAIEGVYEEQAGYTVVRGYDRCHRLQRVRRTRAFLDMSDADIATRIARDAGLELGEIEPTGVVHAHLTQYNQTDWEFLRQRSAEIGYEFGFDDGLFAFRAASSVEAARGVPLTLTLRKNLRSFTPRLTAGNLAPEVEVRVWDPAQAKVVASRARVASGAAAGQQGPTQLAGLFRAAGKPTPTRSPAPPKPGQRDYGPAPSESAFVVHDRPVGAGAATDPAASQAARGLAERVGGTFAEAEGDAAGSARIQAGSVVRVEALPAQFPNRWLVTKARHVFDYAEGGYHTRFTAGGRDDRSLLALASAGSAHQGTTRVAGLVCAVVTNINGTSGRVKVTLPWLSPDYESDWAPVVQFGAGPRSGALFLPEVGDEVLVGFEYGDPRRPYVLGGVLNERTGYSLGGPAVQTAGATASVVRRGFVSASGNLLAFLDEMPPGEDGGKPTRSQVVLGTPAGRLGLAIDAVDGSVVLSCLPEGGPGRLTVQCGQGGTVNIQAGAGGTLNIDGGQSLTVKSAGSLTIESSGDVSVKGASISLN